MDAFSSVRVTAPPGSGKSCLVQLVASQLRERQPQRRVVLVPCIVFEDPKHKFSDADVSVQMEKLLSLMRIRQFEDVAHCTLLLDDGLRVFQSALGVFIIKELQKIGVKVVFFNAFYSTARNTISPVVDVKVFCLLCVPCARISYRMAVDWLPGCPIATRRSRFSV